MNTKLELGVFLVKAFQIDGVDRIIRKKVMPLTYSFFKENEASIKPSPGLVKLDSWGEDSANLVVIKPGEKDFSIELVEEMSSLELLLMELSCFDKTARAPLLEDILMVFQGIILHGVKIED